MILLPPFKPAKAGQHDYRVLSPGSTPRQCNAFFISIFFLLLLYTLVNFPYFGLLGRLNRRFRYKKGHGQAIPTISCQLTTRA